MDRHLKERLVGAVVLVAAAIILIPAMLPGTRDATAPVASGKPAADGGMKSYTIDLTAPKSRDVASPPAQQPAIAALPDEGAPQIAEKAATEAPAQVAVQAAPQLAAPVRPATEMPAQSIEKSAAKPASSEPDKPVERPPEKPVAAAPAEGSWAVQVASFGARTTSERIADDLKAKGFSAYVVSVVVKEQTMYRVRVGPVRDRDAAEALLAKVKPLHPNAAVVTQ